MQYNLKNTGDYPSTTQDKDKPHQNTAIPDPKISSETFKTEQEEQITQPIANTSRLGPIQDSIIEIEASTNKQQLHTPTAYMLKENSSENQEDEKDSNILGELEYCEEYNELG